MSAKKSKQQRAFLKNFTTNVEHRNIAIENSEQFEKYQEIASRVSDTTNQLIQKLNAKIQDRQLPYITLTVVKGEKVNAKSRAFLLKDEAILVNNADGINTHVCNDNVKLPYSHFVGILIAQGYMDIVDSPWGSEIPTEIIINKDLLECILIDMLLDIAMFNSYSFLKENSLEDRQKFSYSKCRYYNENKNEFPCFYDYKGKKDLYYSFAFSARRTENSLDLDAYIQLWNSFIKSDYSLSVHKEESIEKQLMKHKDYRQLPLKIHKVLTECDKGAYLLLRTNSKGRSKKIHSYICSVFKMRKFRIGKVKIVPIEKLMEYRRLLMNLNVSAFKIVKW